MDSSPDATSTEAGIRGRSRLRFAVMAAVGLASGGVAAALGAGLQSVVIGWAVACLTFLVWVWAVVVPLPAGEVRTHAHREDPSRPTSHLLLVLASVASLVTVVVTVVEAHDATGLHADLLAGLALASVALSWFLIHTLYMLRYAVLYYSGETVGGIDFNQDEPPAYLDFAYVAFDLGMTFQISDTSITQSAIRHVVLGHCLLSYLFGSVILATLINLVAGLGS
ncbi:putative membrane protein [Frondihabitans sp. PhB188]|uniref:DUF1345 domain-containing protein n=1 Tax=Frondihabitans sp. PhB188 TaxID=2485200 RepID=UPI000F4A89A3|nr:DUF1345 domain-containing protein [Frondihabitans sp. PhB188]ROQ40810.1 putative membrane protein [Frondihabitans sp. PhB188]